MNKVFAFALGLGLLALAAGVGVEITESGPVGFASADATGVANSTTELVEAWLPVILLITVVSFIIAAFKGGMRAK